MGLGVMMSSGSKVSLQASTGSQALPINDTHATRLMFLISAHSFVCMTILTFLVIYMYLADVRLYIARQDLIEKEKVAGRAAMRTTTTILRLG
jgi:hypothetical protein